MSWLWLTACLVGMARPLITQWLRGATETWYMPEIANLPEPDQLPPYLALKLALKEQLLAELEDDYWWNSVTDKLPDDFFHTDLELSGPVQIKVNAWAETQGVSFDTAAERLLISGLADDELDKIAQEIGWQEKEQIDGGPSWT